MNKSEVIQYFERHLARMRWNWHGTVSFRRRDIPFWMADRAFHEWKAYIWEQNSKDDGRWVQVTERDANGTNIRFHVFISELSVESKWPWAPLARTSRWRCRHHLRFNKYPSAIFDEYATTF
jgi:hypothetical protein